MRRVADNEEEDKLPAPSYSNEPDQRVPEHWMDDEEVEALDVPYSTRSPSDWVISGPLGDYEDSRGGRRFRSWAAAEMWARSKYGRKLKGRLAEAENSACNRWAFLIKKLGA